MTGAASRAVGQARTGETVIQKATEEFENSPLKTTSLGQSLYTFSGDGGDVTAIVDDSSTLLIDSGLASRITELSDAIFKTTMRPVTRLVNTHWHFDHTGGNTYLGSSGVIIIAQENAINKGGIMKNILAVVALAVCMAVPSFASDVVGHSVKVTGKETYKAAKVSA